MPTLSEYSEILKEIWERGILTNQGPCVQELERKMKEYLSVPNFQYLSNGTIALQFALNALNITDGEVITTPFSYVATVSSILWERCTPVFIDIEPDNFTIDSQKIRAAITSKTRAIMGVHVFGYACNVDEIELIAKEYNLKVIYDGAHAFGAKYKGNSLLSYGDISTVSFHATKLFHTIEGGACIIKDNEVSNRLDLTKRFGHNGDTHYQLGINGKTSEFHAAMGLANFPYIDKIISARKTCSELYDKLLNNSLGRPKNQNDLDYNYAYYPIVFKSEKQLLDVFSELNKMDVYPRRYFYPSLNQLPYLNYKHCEISEDISKRIACLPLYVGLKEEEQNIIVDTIKKIID
ncbi:DegT/DnrJ/EryC1/StrS family aminotransferase [Gilliamella sp. W8136]|uniref:DegT/DnrJ/EryC1/StrS family aminotransferase n=2 Tax=Orbaceae TaxID=1240483 RepID=A0A556SRJ0_9GAMM|nr:DegT/DnrJ/EryC1/StrS family aminotransferase [Gilliamella sp. W8136]KES17197.1 putative pyridoxal phosphate-dependent enzyme [Gilliamella apicola SCGC AB-598-B02]MBI0094601.1 DegT/DnrJ/EryC1/StrS family aminotransferase [Gilliamella sp. W8136]TSK03761.1 DegT/DnrJ/EryC1/StrS family aminotransferase [Gilliamella apicola]